MSDQKEKETVVEAKAKVEKASPKDVKKAKEANSDISNWIPKITLKPQFNTAGRRIKTRTRIISVGGQDVARSNVTVNVSPKDAQRFAPVMVRVHALGHYFDISDADFKKLYAMKPGDVSRLFLSKWKPHFEKSAEGFNE